MHSPPALALALVLLGTACFPARAPDPPAEPERTALQRAYDLPSTDERWGARHYEQLRDVLVRVELEHPELLPRHDGPDAALMARMTDLSAVEAAARSVPTLGQLLHLGHALADIVRLYTARAVTRADYGREYIDLAAVFFKFAAFQTAAAVAEPGLDAAALRADPVRLDRFVKARWQLAHSVRDVLVSALDSAKVIDPARCSAAIAGVADDIAPWFLPEERSLLRAKLDEFAGTGAAAVDLAVLRKAFARERQPHPLVDALDDEHRRYKEREEILLANAAASHLDPVEVRPEAAGTRYAFPEAGFSGVFTQRPVAQRSEQTASDGVPLTMRSLGLKDSFGLARAITCITRARAFVDMSLRDQVDVMVAGLKLKDVRTLELAGAAYVVEGTDAAESHAAVMRLVGVDDRTICVLIAEYPQALANDLLDDARRFVAAFELGGFQS